jgi:protoporphyrinogen oxidase
LVTGLESAEKDGLRALRYQGVVCVSVVLRRPLAPYYLTYITDPGLPFTTVVEMSAFVDRAEFGGNTLVYLPKYVGPDDALFDEEDDAIVARFVDALRTVHPGLASSDVLAARVSKVRAVFPIPTQGYSDRVPGFDTTMPGVHLVSSAQIVNGTLNVNDTVMLADRAAAALLVGGGSGVCR